MTKKVINFKLEYDEKEEVTPYAGLGIYGEMYKATGINREVDKNFEYPGSGAGLLANEYINPLVLMLIGGGRFLEDIRKIKADTGLQKICKLKRIPTADAIGDWIRRDSRKKTKSLKRINDKLTERIIKKAEKQELTLDIDAMEIEAAKFDAEYTYNKVKGYMPLLGFIAELDWCCGYEFREGNISPQERNYEFTREIIRRIEKGTGKTIQNFRSDSAGYQGKLIEYLNREGKRYTITADQDSAVKDVIGRIPETEWKQVVRRDGIKMAREYAETVHTMDKTDHAFRLIVQRWVNPQQDLFKKTERYCYHVIATNFSDEEKPAQEIIWWHNGRSNSENYNKELKIGFNLEYMPCGEFGANAVWFGIGILAYSLFIASKLYLFPQGWLKKTIATVRWQFIQTAGRIIKSGRYIIMRICSIPREIYELYKRARELCWELQYNL